MVNVAVEPKSAPSTAPYAASDPIQGNRGADWCGDTTNLYRSALPFAFEMIISEIDAERQKLELDITQEFEFADGEATLLLMKQNDVLAGTRLCCRPRAG